MADQLDFSWLERSGRGGAHAPVFAEASGQCARPVAMVARVSGGQEVLDIA